MMGRATVGVEEERDQVLSSRHNGKGGEKADSWPDEPQRSGDDEERQDGDVRVEMK